MATESGFDETPTIDRPKIKVRIGGKKGRGADDYGRTRPPAPGGRGTGGGDEFDRVTAMLERIRKTLRSLVYLSPPLLRPEAREQFVASWPFADRSIAEAISIIGNEQQRAQILRQLEAAGFTGPMLQMKENSVNRHMDRVDRAVLSYSQKPSLGERFMKWIKPGFKVMNSIMGSLVDIVPGIHAAKEFKEHVEAEYEVVETMGEDREL